MIKVLIGIAMVIAGACLGLYVGLWLCLIGGIIQIVEGIKADPVSSFDIAAGVARIIFTSFCGWLSAMVLVLPGFCMIGWGAEKL